MFSSTGKLSDFYWTTWDIECPVSDYWIQLNKVYMIGERSRSIQIHSVLIHEMCEKLIIYVRAHEVLLEIWLYRRWECLLHFKDNKHPACFPWDFSLSIDLLELVPSHLISVKIFYVVLFRNVRRSLRKRSFGRDVTRLIAWFLHYVVYPVVNY